MAGFTISPVSDGVVVAELDRGPENLWTLGDLHELTTLLTDPPEGAHVVRVRSVGEAFCLGRERGGTSTAPGVVRGEAETLVAVTRAFRRTRLVTVAEVQGDAAGFGVGVLAACDVAVAVADARISFPEVGIGLAPALAWLPRKIGERQAFWLTATGEKITAARAAELGLLNAVVGSAEELRKDVDERVALLRARSPRVHADIRDMLRAFGAVGDDQALDMSIDRLVVGSLRRGED
jgi:methylglutaconyl-CoA hydratase